MHKTHSAREPLPGCVTQVPIHKTINYINQKLLFAIVQSNTAILSYAWGISYGLSLVVDKFNNMENTSFTISTQKLYGNALAHSEAGTVYLHSCTINGQPHIVYPVGLEETAQQTFAKLQSFAHNNRLRLLEERRSKNAAVMGEKRKPWLPVLLLTVSANLAAESGEPEDYSESLHLSSPQAHQTSEEGEMNENLLDLINHKETFAPLSDSASSLSILRLLQHHFQPSMKDPKDINYELESLADYYSQFPHVIELFENLDNLAWQLHFEKRSFRTEVSGSKLHVESAKVFFDPQFGARLKFQRGCEDKLAHCVASPADALLHELLHVRSILRNPEAYIASGGMGGLLYPFEHERRTIEEENQLYRSMSALDAKPRPIRNEHTGRYVMVACTTCID
ncbi:hypothetical protein SAMN02745866_03037 [Alteromonadaceae bacterium Bs31]|nr:hypothetical protein SAMN02745866_03037 [Alteromonadaceae bacterium Bs31]